jgi:hypothetical protein
MIEHLVLPCGSASLGRLFAGLNHISKTSAACAFFSPLLSNFHHISLSRFIINGHDTSASRRVDAMPSRAGALVESLIAIR